MKLAAIVLTYNEEIHIERCLKSLKGVAAEILVVDSYSNDKTIELAQQLGARVLQNTWVNQATQFNWALEQIGTDVDWIIRVDADEYLSEALQQEINKKLPKVLEAIAGISVNRQMVFSGKMIRFGGALPIKVVRLLRPGRGQSENRWMDEHIVVEGGVDHFSGDLVDHNLNSTAWWIAKHNNYSSREAVELLNLKHHFLSTEAETGGALGAQSAKKRWIKEKIYVALPAGLRALFYFFYRYVIRLGFLDGRAGSEFHFLQGLWYRYLVDVKVLEVERYMKENNVSITEAIEEVLEIAV